MEIYPPTGVLRIESLPFQYLAQLQRENDGQRGEVRVTPEVWKAELRENLYHPNGEGIFLLRGVEYSFGAIVKLTKINANLEIDLEEKSSDDEDGFGDLSQYLIDNSTGQFMIQ